MVGRESINRSAARCESAFFGGGGDEVWGPKKSFNGKELSEAFPRIFWTIRTHKMKGLVGIHPKEFTRSSPNNLGRQILGNTFSGLKRWGHCWYSFGISDTNFAILSTSLQVWIRDNYRCWPFSEFINSKLPKLSRPDSCSVDFGRETPKFRFEFCCGFFGGFFPPIFSKEKAQKNPPKNPPQNFTWDFVRKNSPRISAEAFSWEIETDVKYWSNKKYYSLHLYFSVID